MSNKELLDNIKKLRELTGVGFKDCKLAIDENNGDIEKSIEFLRKKGIAKASKKMSRTASEGLALVKQHDGNISIIEINSETDFVAKNKDFISFCKEISESSFNHKANLDKINSSLMQNKISVKDNLVDLIAKIGEKELEIIKAELVNSGKKPEMIEKISQGKLNKFTSENSLLSQVWIMDPKMKVSDIIKDSKVIEFTRYKVGEGV